MQVAINVVLFFLGFSLAVLASTRPKTFRADVERILGNVNYILESLRPTSRKSGPAAVVVEQSFGNHNEQVIFTRAEVEQTFPVSTWQRQAFDVITALLEPRKHPKHKTFPCIYATKGQRDDEHRYVFLHSDDPSEPRNVRILAKALREYLPSSRSFGKNTSVLTVCPPSPPGSTPRSFEYYNQVFWDLLRGLRIADTKSWPEDIPQSTKSSKWAFCYAGEAVFPVALTPLYEKRHSRWAPGLVVALQPKWVFDQLLGTPEGRRAATTKVRSLLQKYDDVDISPDLTAYGEEGTSEVHQLFLRDDNDISLQCPFVNIERAGRSDSKEAEE